MDQNFITLLPNLNLIKVIGANAESFLQGQLTCDLRTITATQSHLAAHCNAKGRVLTIMRVFKWTEHFYLLTSDTMVDLTLEHLKKYAPFSRVTLEKDPSLAIAGACGAELLNELARILGGPMPTTTDQASALTDCCAIAVHGQSNRCLLLGAVSTLQTLPLTTNAADWHQLDMEAGLTTLYPATSDLFTPHMLNLPELNAVSFNKGCYVGQEIIARTHYLGKAKRHLQLAELTTTTPPQPSALLHNKNQQEVGVVTDIHPQNSSSYQLLAVIQDEALAQPIFWENKQLIFSKIP